MVSAERILRILIHLKTRPKPGDVQAPDSWQREMLQALSGPLSLFILIYGVYGAMVPLFSHFQGAAGRNLVQVVAQKAADMGGTVALFWFLFRLVGLLDNRLKRWAAGTESTLDDMLVPIVGKTLRNLHRRYRGHYRGSEPHRPGDRSPARLPLGIGGLAVALAAKETISNFFGTLTILFDKPFQVGQRVVADGHDGTVEAVGFRSTRIRTLTGHLVTIPNEKVVNTTLENIGSRPYIRWTTNIGITYDTLPEKVERAVAILREILADHEGMNADLPPRVFFNGFNDWSLNIFVIAWYHPPDYWAYQAWLERTCLDILVRFRQEGIDFAFPSRTLYLAGDDKRRLSVRFSEEKGSGTKPDALKEKSGPGPVSGPRR